MIRLVPDNHAMLGHEEAVVDPGNDPIGRMSPHRCADPAQLVPNRRRLLEVRRAVLVRVKTCLTLVLVIVILSLDSWANVIAADESVRTGKVVIL